VKRPAWYIIRWFPSC